MRLDLVDLDEAGELVLEAFRLTAPKKVVREFESGPNGLEPNREK